MPEQEQVVALEKPGRIAVVAVHGVADQREGDSSTAMAKLLLNLKRGAHQPVYSAFKKTALRIATEGVHAAATAAAEPPAWNPFNERSRYVQQAMHGKQAETVEPPDHAFTRELLCGYQNCDPNEHYATDRLEGARASGPGQNEIAVHVYELYWADLSRIGTGVLQILFELYQLAFHVPSLGRTAVDHARMRHPESRSLNAFAELQAWTARVLTVPVPVLNLAILPFVFGLLALTIQPVWSAGVWWAGGITLGVTTLAGLTFALFRARTVVGWLAFGSVLANAGLAAYLYRRDCGMHQFLMLDWTLIGMVACGAVIMAFDRRRPGAKLFAIVTIAPLAAFFVFRLLRATEGNIGRTRPPRAVHDRAALRDVERRMGGRAAVPARGRRRRRRGGPGPCRRSDRAAAAAQRRADREALALAPDPDVLDDHAAHRGRTRAGRAEAAPDLDRTVPPSDTVWTVDLDGTAQPGATDRREFCLGPGAHTHYWDQTAAPIAVEIDRLIVQADRGCRRRARADGEQDAAK